MYVVTETGTYRAGERHYELVPAGYKRGDRLVIWCHEHGASGGTYYNVADAQGARSIAQQGLIQAAADLGGPHAWGGPTAMQAIDQLWALMVARYGVASDKILLFGGSMGGLTVLNYVRNKPQNVQAALSVIPAANLQYHWDVDTAATDPTDRFDYRADLTTIWGSEANMQANFANYSPYHYRNLQNLTVPLSVWNSSNDDLTPPEYSTAYAQAVGADLHDMGPVGHSFAGGKYSREWAKWLRWHA